MEISKNLLFIILLIINAILTGLWWYDYASYGRCVLYEHENSKRMHHDEGFTSYTHYDFNVFGNDGYNDTVVETYYNDRICLIYTHFKGGEIKTQNQDPAWCKFYVEQQPDYKNTDDGGEDD